MPGIENFHDIPEECLELGDSSGFLEEDLALGAFESLIANEYDRISAHALGVSL